MENNLNILDIPFEPIDFNSKDHPILIFIHHKLAIKNLESEINFNYFHQNLKVTDAAIGIIIGILLDNAIRETFDKKIIINIKIDKLVCLIEVGNQISPDKDINNIFYNNGFSTKKEIGHGYGLSKLKEIIEYINADINISTQLIHCTTYVFFK